MSNPDIVFSKEQLYDRIWGMDAFGDLKTIIVHINRLRGKIEADPQNPEYIQTVWGAGYRFMV
jgi:DNA-binding response OmpR family regulator